MTHSAQHITSTAACIFKLTKTLTLENLREPTALLWTAIAPSVMFIFATQNNRALPPLEENFLASAAWFYSYISASVAFFGFSFYLIGRRESGFLRSFIYQRNAIRLFLASHTLSYSLLSFVYSSLFYIVAKPLYGPYSANEFFYLTACFYTSYLIFTCIGLVIIALPIKFSTASTLFSLMSFLMLLSGYLGAAQHSTPHAVTLLSPLYLSTQIFLGDVSLPISFLSAFSASTLGIYLTGRFFRTQPVWSRY
ncbi:MULTISPECIES: hypothetical protein [Pseudomonas]|jgi:ABC-2 type transport system permease protein|uniref:hypothetical protein n=1 Tax=Pseudomonas TaxID=286 RepID=UPI002093D1CE|nr:MULTISPECIES: hypothetical protein [Pseudomonas]USS54518.1 hypothetical protein NG836_22375 [Pseudomonas kermanshahensis]UVL65380.1 hypothetical protein LOY53_18415 [Pseudomonas sp. B21-031]